MPVLTISRRIGESVMVGPYKVTPVDTTAVTKMVCLEVRGPEGMGQHWMKKEFTVRLTDAISIQYIGRGGNTGTNNCHQLSITAPAEVRISRVELLPA